MPDNHDADERRNSLWDRIRALAERDGTVVALRHVCLVARTALDAEGVAVYQTAGDGTSEPVAVTGPLADRLSEAQITFGEGPALEAMADERPVLAADLDARQWRAWWPVYAPFASAEGIRAVTALPVVMGAVVVGGLEADHARPAAPDRGRLADGLLLADAAMLVMLRGAPGHDPFGDGLEVRWAAVHQATGVVSVQLGCDLATAFVRLRAHAYRTGRRLVDVAADVVAHRVAFAPESGREPDAQSESEQG
ncbi:GAF domain-containing protein [Saccharothrix mutabilis subsp. mutabilis]|uniref:GAF domain-containing protein n=1 Tax=Saccharothrix mutabilis subsp. mutabilis TaxID=66855 RepID=A0ABP3E3K2_9PSEU